MSNEALEVGSAIESAASWYDMACALLSLWRARDRGHVSWRDSPDDAVWEQGEDFGETLRLHLDQVREQMEGRITEEPTPEIKAKLIELALAGPLPPTDLAKATALAIDIVFWPTFTDSWMAGRTAFELHEAQFYPVAEPPLDELPIDRLSSRPQSLDLDVDELPHIRMMESHPEFELIVSAQFETTLDSVLRRLDALVTVQPNLSIDELHIPAERRFHGVVPATPERQREILESCCEMAFSEGAVVVLPELSVTSNIVDALQLLLNRQEQDCLLVAGSLHGSVEDRRCNLAYGLLPDHEDRLEHEKFIPFENQGRIEHIQPRPRARITVYISKRWRVVMGVCKDLASKEAVALLGRCGVNLLAVPAMSNKTDPFVASLGALVAHAQAFGIVANNPRDWKDRLGNPLFPATAVFSQPAEGRITVKWPDGGGGKPHSPPGICILKLGGTHARFVKVPTPSESMTSP